MSSSTGDLQGSIEFGGLTRTYLVHLPTSYNPSRATALVLAFHGGGGDGAGMAHLTNLDQLADESGFIVVYPNGYMRGWADGRGATAAEHAGVDDVGFISALIEKLAGDYNIDRARVYATGISNGGFFSQRLACDLSNKIAAIAVVAATFPENLTEQCHPQRPVPVLLIHGTDDPLVPASGGIVRAGEDGRILSVNATAALWVHLDGCAGTSEVTYLPDSANDGTSIQIITYRGCSGGAQVTIYVVQGGGHTWPSGLQYLPVSIIGRTSHNIDANVVIWDFFQKYEMA